jgi:hypothetical protein
MAETMSHVERVLWRIAELGARCSQQAAAGGRNALWAELEQTIAGLEAELEAARQAVDSAPAQVRSLEGRLKVAQQERDREKARAKECYNDAEAARRERDRAIAKARKAMAISVEAKAAAIEARSAAAESVARASAAEAAIAQAVADRNEAINALADALKARDDAVDALAEVVKSRDEAVNALADALTTGERAADARDLALEAKNEAVRALDEARARIAELEAALGAAQAEQADTVETLAARAEGAVVVLPGVPAPEAPAGPIPSPARVSWQPTWSEWSRPEAGDTGVPDVPAAAPAAADAIVDAILADDDEIDLDEPMPGEEVCIRRYLNVAATIAQLLPEDLDPLLLSGSSVVRREGRLFATVAVTMTPWSAPGTDTAQAERFADAGFKVEWTQNAPLSV